MDHVKALAIKFAITAIVLYSILGIFYTATMGEIFLITVLVTGVAYVIGDLFILPRFGNLTATIADFGLCFLAVWMLSSFFFGAGTSIFAASAFAALFIAIGEAIFHIYMQSSVLDTDSSNEDRTVIEGNFQTEFAEEDNSEDIITVENDSNHDKKD